MFGMPEFAGMGFGGNENLDAERSTWFQVCPKDTAWVDIDKTVEDPTIRRCSDAN